MARLEGFVGPSYTDLSLNSDAQRTRNLYAQQNETGHGKTPWVLYPTPGLAIFATLGVGPIRGLFSQDGRCFAVSGNGFYEINSVGTATFYGLVALDGNPAFMASNGSDGHQLLVISGGLGYIFDLNTNILAKIADVDFPADALMCGFLDGYFLVLQAGTGTFYASALEDGTSWNGLDVGQSNQSSDITQALIVNHREIWLPGSQTTTIWYDNGDASFPFAPANGVFIERGILAPFTLASLDNTVFWLGGNQNGGGIAYRANGYTPQRISTHAIEHTWTQYPTMTDAISWVYEENGHSFYTLYFPTGDVQWSYDMKEQQWHERAHWNPDTLQWVPHVARCHTYFDELHLVGDRRFGVVYVMSQDLVTEELATGTL